MSSIKRYDIRVQVASGLVFESEFLCRCSSAPCMAKNASFCLDALSVPIGEIVRGEISLRGAHTVARWDDERQDWNFTG